MRRRARLCHSMSSVHLSVRDLQVTWSHKLNRLLRNTCSHCPQHRRSGPTGTPQKQGGIGVRSGTQKLQYLRNCASNYIGQRCYYDGLIGSRPFDWYQNQWPWMTLNCRNVILAEIKSFSEPSRKNWMKIPKQTKPNLLKAEGRILYYTILYPYYIDGKM